MAIPITQWEAVGGVAHAWIAQCEGYISLCGREVSGLSGQRSGIRCAQCTASSGWAEQTSESSYLTPQTHPMVSLLSVLATEPIIMDTRASPTRRQRRAKPMVAQVISPPQQESIQAHPIDHSPDMAMSPAHQDVSPLAVPDSMDVYRLLPITEQYYWAPLMLARSGQDAVWNRDDETAAQFQQRCYQQLMD